MGHPSFTVGASPYSNCFYKFVHWSTQQSRLENKKFSMLERQKWRPNTGAE
jgi:hypothetical protein